MNDILRNLNTAQKEAVTTTTGPLLVIAGAGSGKTRVLVHRIAYLIANGADPGSILAVTFTNKAAQEMKERIRELLSLAPESIQPYVGTFHALGVYVLRRDGHHINIPRSFTILDEIDTVSVVKRIIKERKLDPKQFQPARVRHVISALKNKPYAEESGEDDDEPAAYPKEIKELYRQYQQELAAAHALDFDDLLLCTEKLLRTCPAVLTKWQNRWRYCMVDEYQDTNRTQYAISKLLAGVSKNIMAVGDVDQAIYSWRGADFRNILSFERDWPDVKVITLEQNYRSTGVILEAANMVIQKNKERKEKNLWTERAEGPRIELAIAENERHEARLITGEIARMRREGAAFRDIAILIRTNAQSRALEEEFLRTATPYRLVGGVRFYERREIKDILAYMRLAANPGDRVSMRRVINTPTRGIGAALTKKYFSGQVLSPKEQARIAAFEHIMQRISSAYASSSPSDLVREIITAAGFETHLRDGTPEGEDRWANAQELLTVTAMHDHTPPPQGTDTFLEEAALLSDADMVDKTADAVHIMTVHAAKGLEFETVFVTGLEEGIFPHSLSMHDAAHMEEERRLCYVALTRAKTKLYVSTAQTRTLYGETIWSEPSRFLADIPEHLIVVAARPEGETNYLDDEETVHVEL